MKELRSIQIDGIAEIDKDISNQEFTDKFIQWIESNGWYFGGGISNYKEDDEN